MRRRRMTSSGRWVAIFTPREAYCVGSAMRRRMQLRSVDRVCELGITSREGLLNWAEVNRPHELAVAKRVMQVERATGYRHWYDWQLINWGCKWSCAGFVWRSDDQTAFLMSTPWSAPTPIFKKLVELFPTLTFACHFVEECDGIDETETYAAQ